MHSPASANEKRNFALKRNSRKLQFELGLPKLKTDNSIEFLTHKNLYFDPLYVKISQ